MNEKILINRLPVRTWNRLGVNAAEIEWKVENGAAQQRKSPRTRTAHRFGLTLRTAAAANRHFPSLRGKGRTLPYLNVVPQKSRSLYGSRLTLQKTRPFGLYSF